MFLDVEYFIFSIFVYPQSVQVKSLSPSASAVALVLTSPSSHACSDLSEISEQSSPIDTCPELLRAKKERFEKQYGLNAYDIDLLLVNKLIANFFEEVAKDCKHYKLIANWINVDIMSHLNSTKKGIQNFEIAAKPLSILINAVAENKISSKQAKEIFAKGLKGENIEKLVKESGSSLISSEDELLKMIKTLIDNNPQGVEDYKNGKDRVVGFIVGQLMKQTQGKANPGVASKLIIQELKSRI